jgi:hypothetical protein
MYRPSSPDAAMRDFLKAMFANLLNTRAEEIEADPSGTWAHAPETRIAILREEIDYLVRTYNLQASP